MGTYIVSGRGAATAVTIDHALAQLWNPHASLALMLKEVWVVATVAPAAGAGLSLRRTTARGTAGSSLVIAQANEVENRAVPSSGAVVDFAAFATQPTLAAGSLARWVFAAAAASGAILPFPHNLEIPAGTGMALTNTTAIIFPVSDITFIFAEN